MERNLPLQQIHLVALKSTVMILRLSHFSDFAFPYTGGFDAHAGPSLWWYCSFQNYLYCFLNVGRRVIALAMIDSRGRINLILFNFRSADAEFACHLMYSIL